MAVDEATHDKIKSAFANWYRRLNAREDNVGFFYFCGHGVEASDRYLLPADFGSNDLDWTEHIIDFTLTHNNMDKCRAGTQCFFLDCCRDRPLDLQSAAASGPVGRPLLGPQQGPIRDRDGQIYHAAAPASGVGPGERQELLRTRAAGLSERNGRGPAGRRLRARRLFDARLRAEGAGLAPRRGRRRPRAPL